MLRATRLDPFATLLRACLKMGGSVWEGRVRLARREEEADPQRSVTDKQRRQRALPSQTLRAAGLSGLDCVGSGGTDRRRSAPPLTALPNPEFPSRRTPPHFQTGSKAGMISIGSVVLTTSSSARASLFAGCGLPVGRLMIHNSFCDKKFNAITLLPTESIRWSHTANQPPAHSNRSAAKDRTSSSRVSQEHIKRQPPSPMKL